MLDFHSIIPNLPTIPQQPQEFVCIFFHGQLSQSQLVELFNLIIILPVREVLLFELLLELLPHNLSVIDLLQLPEVLPPYRCSSIQSEYGYHCLHISRVVLDLEILFHPKKPSFSFLTIFYVTIKGRRPFLLKFIT